MTKYPTKEKILKKRPSISKQTLEFVKDWKSLTIKNWKNLSNWEKILRIDILIKFIIRLEANEEIEVRMGPCYAYDPTTKIIYQDINNPSIISALHETAHYLLGKSELKACRWSVWIFKEVFPIQYKKLEWKGHQLIKTPMKSQSTRAP